MYKKKRKEKYLFFAKKFLCVVAATYNVAIVMKTASFVVVVLLLTFLLAYRAYFCVYACVDAPQSCAKYVGDCVRKGVCVAHTQLTVIFNTHFALTDLIHSELRKYRYNECCFG